MIANYSGNPHVTSLNKTRSLEWCLATLLIVWGASILEPGDFFTNPIYKVMGELANESRWGMVAMLIALLRVVGLGINGFWKRSPILRFLGSFFSCGFWIAIWYFMYVASGLTGAVLPVGVRYYVVFFAFEMWCIAAAAYDMYKNKSVSYVRTHYVARN